MRLVVGSAVLLQQAEVEHAEDGGQKPPGDEQDDQQDLHAAASCLTRQLSRSAVV